MMNINQMMTYKFLNLKHCVTKRYIYNIKKETDERNQINIIDDKESDETDNIG